MPRLDRVVKLIFEWILAVLLIAILLPFLVIIFIIAYSLIGENPLFRQVRIGMHRKPFVLYKIRTMSKAEGVTQHAFFHYLRKTHIDELLQLFNVLEGSMSLVGPRPHIPEHVEKYEEWQLQRLSVKPGMTGLRQVRAHSQKLKFNDKIEDDIEYIDNWSLKVDFKILLTTICIFFKTISRY